MKKKHRDIIIDGIQYGWIVKHGGNTIEIWKDKKVILEKLNISSESITPSLIEFFIRTNILGETMVKTVYLCSHCNSDNVQVKAWVKPNENNLFVEEIPEEIPEEIGWCEDEELHSHIETAQISRDAKVIGFQVVDEINKDIHPIMDASFCVYSLSQANAMLNSNDNHNNWRLLTIWSNDIEEPTIMFKGNPRD